jgi:L-asparagine oxygenase
MLSSGNLQEVSYLDALRKSVDILREHETNVQELKSGARRHLLIRDQTVGGPQIPSERKREATLDNELIREADAFLLGGSLLFGAVYGYTTEQDGSFIQDVLPSSTAAYTPSFKGSRAFLRFHNDITFTVPESFYLTNPDYTCLYCLRENETPVLTYVLSVEDILSKLSDAERELAEAPIFSFSTPYGYNERVNQGVPTWIRNMPILSREPVPEIRFTASGVTSEDERGVELLKRLESEVFHVDNAEAIELKVGDLLVIDNRRALHARSSFTAKFDGRDRWLRRTYVKSAATAQHRDASRGLVREFV